MVALIHKLLEERILKTAHGGEVNNKLLVMTLQKRGQNCKTFGYTVYVEEVYTNKKSHSFESGTFYIENIIF